jgi:hypothetical protein
LCTDVFTSLAHREAVSLGLSDLQVVTLPHPATVYLEGGEGSRADSVIAGVIRGLTEAPVPIASDQPAVPEARSAGGTSRTGRGPRDLIEEVYERGWTDGLPVIPPTRARMRAMLRATSRASREVIGLVPPRWGEATVEVVAANAIMAGCRPEYLPVVCTALEAMLEGAFNLQGIQATTHAVAPMVIVNGSIARALGFNSGHNLCGPGWRANATVGRAINLVLRNVGGAHPGGLDRSTTGQPAKYSFCIAEDEDGSPWSPLHVERGFLPAQSTVTVHGAGGVVDINDRSSRRAEDLLHILAKSLVSLGSNGYLIGGEPLLVVCPEHAALLRHDGISKQALKQYLWTHSQVAVDAFPATYYRDRVEPLVDPLWIPLCSGPDRIMVVVGGGAGRHSLYVPSFGASTSVTRAISDHVDK